MEKASIIKEKTSTYNIDKDTWEDLDLTQFTDEELAALGIDPSEVDRGNPDEEDNDDETEDEDMDEEEDEDGEDDSDESEEDEEGSEEETQRDIRIPKARFDEAVRKERERAKALEERTQYLESMLDKLLAAQAVAKDPPKPEPPPYDFEEAESRYAQALFDGEVEEAKKIRKEINEQQEKRIQKLLAQVKSETETQTKVFSEQQKFQLAIQTALEKYPFLDDKHETYNEELVGEVNALAAGYRSTLNLSAAEALEKAVNKLAAPYAKTKNKTTNKDVVKKRAEKASKIAKEPPRTKGGQVKDKSIDEIDWEAMTEQEFDKLYKTNRKLVESYLKRSNI